MLAIMSTNIEAVTCGNCGVQLAEASPSDLPENRTPCPACGSTARAYHVFMNASITLRGGSFVKAKRGGEKKPYSESMDLPDHNRTLGKMVHRVRLINRDDDSYFERITDYESGEIIHECEEPLSKHIGHGSDTKNRKA